MVRLYSSMQMDQLSETVELLQAENAKQRVEIERLQSILATFENLADQHADTVEELTRVKADYERALGDVSELDLALEEADIEYDKLKAENEELRKKLHPGVHDVDAYYADDD